MRRELAATAAALVAAVATQASADDTAAQPGGDDLQRLESADASDQRATSPAEAAPAGDAQPPARARWYGWETLTIDGAAIGVSALTVALVVGKCDGARDAGRLGCGFVALGGALVGLAAIGAYLLGPPAMHVSHKQVLVGLADLGIRLAAPIATGAIGVGVTHAIHGDSRTGRGAAGRGTVGGLVGGSVGLVAAIVLDAAVLAYEPPKPTPAVAPTTHQALLPASMMPMVSPGSEGGAVFGVSGTLD